MSVDIEDIERMAEVVWKLRDRDSVSADVVRALILRERDACAELAHNFNPYESVMCARIAAAIRARSNNSK